MRLSVVLGLAAASWLAADDVVEPKSRLEAWLATSADVAANDLDIADFLRPHLQRAGIPLLIAPALSERDRDTAKVDLNIQQVAWRDLLALLCDMRQMNHLNLGGVLVLATGQTREQLLADPRFAAVTGAAFAEALQLRHEPQRQALQELCRELLIGDEPTRRALIAACPPLAVLGTPASRNGIDEPLLPAESAALDEAIRTLAATRFRDREAASNQILAVGPRALQRLRAALQIEVDAEQRSRIQTLIETLVARHALRLTLLKVDGTGQFEWCGEPLRPNRKLVALVLDTPERRLLELHTDHQGHARLAHPESDSLVEGMRLALIDRQP
jgi:hypothetical protein